MVDELSKLIIDGKLKATIKEVPFTEFETIIDDVENFKHPETVILTM